MKWGDCFIFVNMATLNYRIKGTSVQPTIILRFKQGREFDYELSTGIKVQRKHWSPAKQKVKIMTGSYDYADHVNIQLSKLKTSILENYYKDLSNGISIGQTWLRNNIDSFFNKSTKKEGNSSVFLIPFIDQYIKDNENRINKITGKPLSRRTIQTYETCKVKLIDFEKQQNSKIKLANINLDFHTKFQDFLTKKHLLNPNSIGGYFDNIKLFCRNADLKGLKVHPEYKSKEFHSPFNKTADIYLNLLEIDIINNHDFSNSERLENARDWLIIGVWTGLRVSDLLRLNPGFIKDEMISITAIKTGINVIIPLHPMVKKVLNKRGGEFPRRISDQKFNKYIKEVCEAVGLTDTINGFKFIAVKNGKKEVFRKQFGTYKKHELVSSHICRRSFATNHYGKIDTLTIMKITGHKTEKQFLDYIKRTPTQYAEQLKEFWESS